MGIDLEALALLLKAAEAGIQSAINARDGEMTPGVAAWEEAVIAARSWAPASPDRAARWATILRVSNAIKAREDALEPGASLSYDETAETAIDAVEVAGWGPRAETVAGTGETLYRKCPHCPGDGTSCWTCDDDGYVPVAPPEPLSAVGYHSALTLLDGIASGTIAVSDVRRVAAEVRDWLAALPLRHAVPVEGA